MGFNKFLRSESALPKKLQELATLVTSRELDCQYIWNAHAALARQAGVSDALRDRKETAHAGVSREQLTSFQLANIRLRCVVREGLPWPIPPTGAVS